MTWVVAGWPCGGATLGGEVHGFPAARSAHVADAIVQAIGTAPPELDRVGSQSIASPVGGARHVLPGIASGEHPVTREQDGAIANRSALIRRGGGELRLTRTRREVAVGILGRELEHPPFHPD